MEALEKMRETFPWCVYDYGEIHNETCRLWEYLKNFIKKDSPENVMFEEIERALKNISRHHCNVHYQKAQSTTHFLERRTRVSEKTTLVTWAEFGDLVSILAKNIKREIEYTHTGFYGVPQNGCFVAQELTKYFAGVEVLDEPCKGCIVVDDIADTGKTIQPYVEEGYDCYTLFWSQKFTEKAARLTGLAELAADKDSEPWELKLRGMKLALSWIIFPWENKQIGGPEDAVVRLLEYIGEDPQREGLIKTPERVIRAWDEMTKGYKVDTNALLKSATFTEVDDYDEMIIVKNIEFFSTCEHHMLPYFGKVSVGYIPGQIEGDDYVVKDKQDNVIPAPLPTQRSVVGVSKIARLVEAHARRLQIQERMTQGIANDLMRALRPLGVGVIINAQHLCMMARGVKQAESIMTTSAMLGVFRTDVTTRAEFLRLSGV